MYVRIGWDSRRQLRFLHPKLCSSTTLQDLKSLLEDMLFQFETAQDRLRVMTWTASYLTALFALLAALSGISPFWTVSVTGGTLSGDTTSRVVSFVSYPALVGIWTSGEHVEGLLQRVSDRYDRYQRSGPRYDDLQVSNPKRLVRARSLACHLYVQSFVSW